VKRRLTLYPGDSVRVEGRRELRVGTAPVTFEGDFMFEVEDLETYVQVKTGSYSRLTYRDPSGTLAVGDFVAVPLGWKNTPHIATVIALGRGSYDGYTKDVTSRFVNEAL
jgi:hypothetical protein